MDERVKEIRQRERDMSEDEAKGLLVLLSGVRAEVERLKGEVQRHDSQRTAQVEYADSVETRAEQAEAALARTRAALEAMLICDKRCQRPQCLQARAALEGRG